MKISARRTEDGAFTLKFDQTEVVLSVKDLKTLLLQVTRLLMPDAMNADASTQDDAAKLASTIKGADDIAIQAFIQAAGEEDILVLLKLGEDDDVLMEKLYGNMTEKMQTLFEEDLGFKYGDGVPDGPAKSAIREMNSVLHKLAADGRFIMPTD